MLLDDAASGIIGCCAMSKNGWHPFVVLSVKKKGEDTYEDIQRQLP
ncbi:hypothetical protein HY213_00105 [Candidatus Peregrinibacteria bacterium]|nr:hypothetical protein [Candidatus Peregrinibacteria bacterium]